MDDAFKQYLTSLIQELITPLFQGKDFFIEIEDENEQWRVNISSDDETLDIVYNDEGLVRALQHILRVKAHNIFPQDRTHFVLDFGKRRSKREKILKDNARKIAESEVLNNGVTLIIVGLSSYERRIIHNLFAEVEGMETISVGHGTSRRLLIRPTSDTGAKGMDNAKVIDLLTIN